MSWGNLVVGIIFILCGICVKFFPNTIAGVNMMTREEKDKFDLKKYSKSLCILLIGFGVVVSVGYYLIYWIGFYYIANNLIIWGFPIFIIIMFILFFKSKNKL